MRIRGNACLLLVLVTLLLLPLRGWACDGCTLFQYPSLRNRNYVQLMYRYRYLQGYRYLDQRSTFSGQGLGLRSQRAAHVTGSGVTIDDSDRDFEALRSLELRFNFRLGERTNLFVMLPFNSHEAYYARVFSTTQPVRDSSNTVSGLGDAILFLERVRPLSLSDNWELLLKYGAGVQLPTGQFNRRDKQGFSYDPTVQPGDGSFFLMLRASPILSFKQKYGLATSINYRKGTRRELSSSVVLNSPGLNVRNRNDYRFGDRLNVQGDLFAVIEKGNKRFVPLAGLYYERAQRDEYGGQEMVNTGGWTLFADLGIDVSLGSVTVNALYQAPLAQGLYDNQLQHAGRLNLGAMYSF